MNILKEQELEFLIEHDLVEKVYMNDEDKQKMNEKYNENFDEFTDGVVEGYYFEILDEESKFGKYDFYKWQLVEDLKDEKNLDKKIKQYIDYQNCMNISKINKNIQFFKTILVIFLTIFIIGVIISILSISNLISNL